jgi:transposase
MARLNIAKARMGATHFLVKTLPHVAAEMALHVLAYNLTRVITSWDRTV